jgi:hypothetical protein
MDIDPNPYVSPAPTEETQATPLSGDVARFGLALLRWFVICSFCAAPSFFCGTAMGREPAHVLGMFCGILCFVVGYAIAECSELYRQISTWPYVKATLQIGYGLRIAISIIFPVALTLDITLGMLSVAIARKLGLHIHEGPNTDAGLSEFVAFFVTTLIQGAMMNFLLFGFMAIVYLSMRMSVVFAPRKRLRKPDA